MRHLTRCAVLAAALLTLAGGCQKGKGPGGKNAGPVSIEQVRVGLPYGRSGKQTALSRNGVWTPVYVTLKAGKDSIPAESYRLAIQTNDAENSPYRYTVAVPAISPEEERVVVAYVQPGGTSSDFTPLLQRPNGDLAATGPKVERKPDRGEILEANDQLFFAIGAQLTGLERTISELEAAEKKDNSNPNDANPNNPNAKQGPAPPAAPEKGHRRCAFVEDDLSLLPDQWFGYDAADVVILETRQPTKFLDVQDDSGKRQRQALLEWVRRGGRVVLSVGKRHDRAVVNLLKQMPLLDLDGDFVDGDFQDATADLKDVVSWCDAPSRESRPIEVAGLKLRGGGDRSGRVQVLLRDPSDRPLILQTSCGLGRVLVVLFDLDAAPFTSWKGESAFWKKVLKEMAPEPNVAPPTNGTFSGDRKPSLGSDLQRGLELFPDVPPTSFGYVALFVLFYIALVGPLDYFILKKFFKRLEWTWLTFPAVVIVVSVTAYAIAYALKGAELRINKVDVVEFDLTEEQPRAYGRTWFTLFSPRIAQFTVGLQPSVPDKDGPGWFPPVPEADRARPPISWLHRDLPSNAISAYPTTLSLLAAPERSASREGDTNLVPQAYEYADAAQGVERVPIPVWAMRTFAASYSVPLNRNTPPFRADLRFGGDDGQMPQGSILNNLPVGLTDVIILYDGFWYECPDLPAAGTRNLDQVLRKDKKRPFQQLFPRGDSEPNDNVFPGNERFGGRRNLEMDSSEERESFYPLVKALFFYELTRGAEKPNNGMRPLDQSWRVQLTADDNRFRNQPGDQKRRELLLVGRLQRETGNAEQLTRSAGSPTRIWLDHLPGTVASRPPLEGTLTQETYVRIYLPIRSRDPK